MKGKEIPTVFDLGKSYKFFRDNHINTFVLNAIKEWRKE